MGHGGQTVNGLSSLGPKMGKAHGGGVNLAPKMMDESQRNVSSGKETQMEDNSMGSAKMISGSHSKGGFMKYSKSYGQAKVQGYNAREDEALGMKDGKESSKKQSDKDRRDESRGENKAQGNKPDGLTKYPTKKSVAKSEKLKMVKKDGKMVPFYAADGEGKM